MIALPAHCTSGPSLSVQANTDCLHQLTFLQKSFLKMMMPTVILGVLRFLAWRTQRLLKTAVRTKALRKQRDQYYGMMYGFAFTVFVMVCNAIFKVMHPCSLFPFCCGVFVAFVAHCIHLGAGRACVLA